MTTFKTLSFLGLLSAGLMVGEGIRENRQLQVEHININNLAPFTSSAPIKIAHISDLQFPRLRVPWATLLHAIKKEQVDVIFLTGDTIDRTEILSESLLPSFLKELTAISPTFIVDGNHERSHSEFVAWQNMIKQSHAIYLDNDTYLLNLKGTSRHVVGLNNNSVALPKVALSHIPKDETLLVLAHHPERIDDYLTSFHPHPIITFSGHAHGGQFRLPGLGGLLSPDQGFFPAYTSGQYTFNRSHLIVSRGLANSSFPLRLNNYPHLIITTIND